MRIVVLLMAWIFKRQAWRLAPDRIHLYTCVAGFHMNEGTDVYLELHAGVWEVHVNRDWTASPYQ
jgi:hypothetical protein